MANNIASSFDGNSESIFRVVRFSLKRQYVTNADTISKCFRKAGILNENFSIASRGHEDQDPFDELDSGQSTDDELEDLIHELNMPAETTCSVMEYVNGDDEVPTCSGMGE